MNTLPPAVTRALQRERDDLARQLGEITAAVAACKHLPHRDTIVETIRAADGRIGALASSSPHPIAEVVGEEFKTLVSHIGISERYEEASRQRVTPMSPRALASLIKDWCYRRATWEASQARRETLCEVAKALGAEEAFEAMEATCGPSGVTPEGLAGAVRITLGLADPFAGIMDGPEMMPTWDGPSDLGDVKMSARCDGDDEGDQ